ncbi:hypothetical protein ACLOJK_031628 [Asimina triloba]
MIRTAETPVMVLRHHQSQASHDRNPFKSGGDEFSATGSAMETGSLMNGVFFLLAGSSGNPASTKSADRQTDSRDQP